MYTIKFQEFDQKVLLHYQFLQFFSRILILFSFLVILEEKMGFRNNDNFLQNRNFSINCH